MTRTIPAHPMRFVLAVLFVTLASGAARAEQAGAHRAAEPPADPPPLVFYEREIQATDGDWIIGHEPDPAVQAQQEAALIEATRAARQAASAGAAVPRSGMAPWALDEPSIPDTTGDWIVGFGSGAPAATPPADDASGTPPR